MKNTLLQIERGEKKVITLRGFEPTTSRLWHKRSIAVLPSCCMLPLYSMTVSIARFGYFLAFQRLLRHFLRLHDLLCQPVLVWTNVAGCWDRHRDRLHDPGHRLTGRLHLLLDRGQRPQAADRQVEPGEAGSGHRPAWISACRDHPDDPNPPDPASDQLLGTTTSTKGCARTASGRIFRGCWKILKRSSFWP